MYLKSLELQGFKSFPDKTKLTFESGATVIVGPNGSGKSNISDAMRWVLGEISSKSIRGTKMEDIIFGGADSRKPMGYAEVSVTFDNTDAENRLDCPYDEVTVTRRYYRAGESEYYINRRPVRLKDIYELFMNTGIGRDGYSIIGQGKIAEIISRKSDERRSIFEDASGIAKYRHKKTETERKLQATEDNMTRINDVFTEVAAQVGPLEKEAEKAKKAIELLETKKRVDVQLWLYDTEKLRADINNIEELYKRSAFELETAEEAIRSFEQQNEKLFEASQSNKLTSEKLLGEIREQTNISHSLDSEYRVTESNIAHTRELIAASEGVMASAEKSAENEKNTQNARLAHIEEITAEVAIKEAEHAENLKKQRALDETVVKLDGMLDESLADIRALENEAVDVKVRISVIENAKNTDTDKNSSILGEIEEYESTSRSLERQYEAVEKTVESYSSSLATIDGELSEFGEKLEGLYGERTECEREISDRKLRRDSVAQRIDNFKAMEEHFEGYNNSVRYVMKAYSEGRIVDSDGVRCAKIYGPLSKVISVDDKYVTAVETALGANLQHIVVEDERVAKNAMFALKKAEAGRATFFPLTSMKSQSETPEMRDARGYRGYIAVANTLVNCDKKFDNVISSLLGRTLIFDSIDNATAMAKSVGYKVRVVTLDGQQINAGGSFTGGSVKKGGSILGRTGEIKRLESELDELDANLEDLFDQQKQLASDIEKLEEAKYSAEEKRKIITVMQNNELARAEQFKAKLDANNTLIEKLREDFNALAETRERYDVDIEELLKKEKELRSEIDEIEAFRAEKDIERNAAIDEKEEIFRVNTELYIKINELQKDIETERTLLASSDERIALSEDERALQVEKIENYKSQIEGYLASQEENRQAFKDAEALLEKLNAERAKVEEDSFEFERKLSAINAKMREKMSQKELIFSEHTKNENKLLSLRAEQDKLSSKLWDEHELTRAEALELNYPTIDAQSRPEAVAKQTECRNKLRAIGNVDLDAVNKYKDVKARYDYMDAQIKDLTAAKNDLVKIIDQLEGEMKTAFVESFNKINENFNRVFAELFGGGSAEISLTEPDDVLTSGIEIKAAPPGKIIKSLMQLSGGEQAFVAIALFFAILQVNPTPFCILDEIEAALDEVNVARFAEYIKRYKDGIQFIMITHRRGTMEAANRLYGVTMPEHGISKVLTLDVGQISKEKGDDWDGIFGEA